VSLTDWLGCLLCPEVPTALHHLPCTSTTIPQRFSLIHPYMDLKAAPLLKQSTPHTFEQCDMQQPPG